MLNKDYKLFHDDLKQPAYASDIYTRMNYLYINFFPFYFDLMNIACRQVEEMIKRSKYAEWYKMTVVQRFVYVKIAYNLIIS